MSEGELWNIWRNLTKSKGDIYAYSVGTPKGNDKGKLSHHLIGEFDVYLKQCREVIKTTRVNAYRTTLAREVFTFIQGRECEPIQGENIRLTYIPKLHDSFIIKATGEVANFDKFKAVRFTPSGVFGIK